jgi:hypothetical protein
MVMMIRMLTRMLTRMPSRTLKITGRTETTITL